MKVSEISAPSFWLLICCRRIFSFSQWWNVLGRFLVVSSPPIRAIRVPSCLFGQGSGRFCLLWPPKLLGGLKNQTIRKPSTRTFWTWLSKGSTSPFHDEFKSLVPNSARERWKNLNRLISYTASEYVTASSKWYILNIKRIDFWFQYFSFAPTRSVGPNHWTPKYRICYSVNGNILKGLTQLSIRLEFELR